MLVRAKSAVLEAILAGAADTVIAYDRELRYVYVSPSAARILGVDADELLGKRPSDQHPPAIARPWQALAECVFDSGQAVRQEVSYGAPGAEERTYEYIMTPVLGEAGTVELVVSIARDVTEERRARRELAAANAAEQRGRERATKLYQLAAALSRATTEQEVASAVVNEGMAALEAEAAVAYLVDVGGRYVLRAARGVSEQTLVDRAVLPVDAPLPLADALRTGEPIWIESLEELLARYPGVRGSGTPMSKLQAVAAVPLRSHERTVGGVAFSFGSPRRFDGDEQRFLLTVVSHAAVAAERCRLRAEERAARKRLTILAGASRRFSEARLELRGALDTVAREVSVHLGESCAVNLLGEDGRVLEPVAIAHIDPEEEEAIRRTMAAVPVRMDEGSILARVVESGEPAFVPEIPEAWAPEGRPEYREHLERFPIGSLMVVPLSARGVVLGTVTASRGPTGPAYTRDDLALLEDLAARAGLAIADARQHEELEAERRRLDVLAQALREAVTVRDDFLSIAGHELNTPLAALQLQIENLSRQGEKESVSQRFRDRLTRTEGQLARLERLVRELLDVSRITGGRLTIEREDMDLVAVVREVSERLTPEASNAGCAIRFSGLSSLSGRWDRLRVEQVVSNLIGNSIKYGRGAPIEVAVAADGDLARITVRDFGIGISPEDEARIFERFERAVSHRHYGGLGLGLWIARQIVEAHGGRITFERPPDIGTRFAVELPR